MPAAFAIPGLRPRSGAARTSFGVMPNSRRDVRANLEVSAKHIIFAIVPIEELLETSHRMAKLSRSRRRWM